MSQNPRNLFQLNTSSGEPIYKQIIEQISRQIMSGSLQPGEELPSVRNVALSLTVNPMTVSKAYAILEATGLLERQRGKGMIVSPQKGKQDLNRRMDMLKPVLKEAAKQAKQLDLPQEQILNLFRAILEENDG